FADTEGAQVDDLHRLWPLKLAPHSRHWVTTRIAKGKITKASLIAHFAPGDFKLKDIPDADIDATVAVKGITVVYKPGDPPIEEVDGNVKFTGETMDAKVTSARYLSGTRIKKGHVRFPDFAPADVRLFVDFDMDAPAKDVQRFLALPGLDKA